MILFMITLTTAYFLSFPTAMADENQNLQDARKLRQKIASLKVDVQQLERALIKISKLFKKLNTASMYQRPDGVIKEISPDGHCVINLSKADRLIPGLRFEVYNSKTDITEDLYGRMIGKATIEVRTIEKDRSRCVVIRKGLGASVNTGDVIANIIYDPKKTFKFYIWGHFDIDNKGRADKREMDKVASLVKKWGGKPIMHDLNINQEKKIEAARKSFIQIMQAGIQSAQTKNVNEAIDMVNIRLETLEASLSDSYRRHLPYRALSPDIDFVVLGKEIEIPQKPDELTGDPSKRKIWQILNRDHHFQKAIEDEARKLGIPILNQNRLLEMLGYHD